MSKLRAGADVEGPSEPDAWMVQAWVLGAWDIVTPGAWRAKEGAERAAELERRNFAEVRVVPVGILAAPATQEAPNDPAEPEIASVLRKTERALNIAGRWFREYEKIHREKVPSGLGANTIRDEQLAKAARNRERAIFCEDAEVEVRAALSSTPSPRVEVGGEPIAWGVREGTAWQTTEDTKPHAELYAEQIRELQKTERGTASEVTVVAFFAAPSTPEPAEPREEGRVYPGREWLERMAKLEDEVGGSISVGGLASDVGLYVGPVAETGALGEPELRDLLTMWAKADEERGADRGGLMPRHPDWLDARIRMIRRAQQDDRGSER